MRRFTFHISILLGLAIATMGGASVANATTYEFTESGFTDGATLSGYFVGSDPYDFGAILYGPPVYDEVSDFSATFSGNSIVGAFQLSFPDLYFLGYDYSGNFYYPGFLEFAAYDDQYAAATSILGPCDGTDPCGFVIDSNGDFDFTILPAIVSVVPEPATWLAMLAGFGLIGSMLRTLKAGKRRMVPSRAKQPG